MTDEVFEDAKLNEEWQKSFLRNILFLDEFFEMPKIVQHDDYIGSSAHREMKAVTMIGLYGLISKQGLTLDRFAAKMEIPKQEAVVLLKELFAKRLIYSENTDDDSNPVQIKLTQLGMSMYQYFVNDIRERAARLASGLSDIEKEVFVKVIDKLYREIREQSV